MTPNRPRYSTKQTCNVESPTTSTENILEMDSMRHLSTSLPQTSRQRNDQPSDLMSDFRQAAFSVSNLYKAAHTAEKRARSAGYQDALDDLLAFLDSENLGLMDGEGWRVRQWATQNLDGDAGVLQNTVSGTRSTSDDEREDRRSPAKEDERDEDVSSSPETHRKPESNLTEDEEARRRVVSEPPPHAQAQTSIHQAPPQSAFTFESQRSYPSNHDREALSGMDIDTTTTQGSTIIPSSTPASTDQIRLVPRTSRANRHSNHKKGSENRIPTLNFNLGSGAGSKRKIPYSDLFDISGFNESADRKDGGNASGRGGKRGRHV